MKEINLLAPSYKIDKPVRLIELFGGIGSQAMALENIGLKYERYRYVDFDKYAVKAYDQIWNEDYEPIDITKLHGSDLGIVDTDKYTYLMTYSFPCQDLSLAGHQKGMAKGSGTRSGLLWEVERLLDECDELPQVLLMENVPNVIGKNNIGDFNQWLEKLRSLGYSNHYQVLNAKDYGIPQNRKRCYMVSILGNYSYEFPKKVELKLRLKDFLEDEVDEKFYLNDAQIEAITKAKWHQDQDRIQEGNIAKALRARDSQGPIAIRVKNANKKGYDTATTGDSINLEQPNSNTRRGRVGHGVAQTLMTSCNQATIQNRVRKLTPKEYWRLMGFPDWAYEKASQGTSNTQLYKQAGNSIVVNVLEAIIKEMI